MAIRPTGIGWASGVGRSVALLAPIVIGTLVGMALTLEQNFMAIAIPAVVATVAVLFINEKRSASAHYNGVDVTDAVPSNSVRVAQAPK